MKTKLAISLCMGWVALWMVSGCGKGNTHYRAIAQVFVSADCVGSNQLQFGKIALTDADLQKYVDELKLPEKWSSPDKSVSKEEAFKQLKSAIQLSPDAGRFTLRVFGSDPAECESLAKHISSSIKTKAEQAAGRELATLIESRQKEIDATQEKLSVARNELVGAKDGAYIPSQYRLTPAYEAELQAKIKNAQAEDAARANEFETLRKLQGEELRIALVKTEMGRIASPSATSKRLDSISTLLSANQSQKSAEQELDMAKSGAINETNAVGHAELKLEQANRILTNTMAAYIKSLEIEADVARARREEMEKQLEKLRQASQKSGEKAGIEKQVESLNARLSELAGELEQRKLCQRMLPDAIRIGSIRVEPVSSRQTAP